MPRRARQQQPPAFDSASDDAASDDDDAFEYDPADYLSDDDYGTLSDRLDDLPSARDTTDGDDDDEVDIGSSHDSSDVDGSDAIDGDGANGDDAPQFDDQPTDAEIRAWLKQEARIGECALHRELAVLLGSIKQLIDSNGAEPPEEDDAGRDGGDAPQQQQEEVAAEVPVAAAAPPPLEDAAADDDDAPPRHSQPAPRRESELQRIVRRTYPYWRRVARLLEVERQRGIEDVMTDADTAMLSFATKAMVKAFRMFTYSTVAGWLNACFDLCTGDTPEERVIFYVSYLLTDTCGSQVVEMVEDPPDFSRLRGDHAPMSVSRRLPMAALMHHMLASEDNVLSTCIEQDLHLWVFDRLHHRAFGCTASERAVRRAALTHAKPGDGAGASAQPQQQQQEHQPSTMPPPDSTAVLRLRRGSAMSAATPIVRPSAAAAMTFPLSLAAAAQGSSGGQPQASSSSSGNDTNWGSNAPHGTRGQRRRRPPPPPKPQVSSGSHRGEMTVSPPDDEGLRPQLDIRGQHVAAMQHRRRPDGKPRQRLVRPRVGLEVVRGPGWRFGAQDHAVDGDGTAAAERDDATAAAEQDMGYHPPPKRDVEANPPRGVIVAVYREREDSGANGTDGDGFSSPRPDRPPQQRRHRTEDDGVVTGAARRVHFGNDDVVDQQQPSAAADGCAAMAGGEGVMNTSRSSGRGRTVVVRWSEHADFRLYTYAWGSEVVSVAEHDEARVVDLETDVDWALEETLAALGAATHLGSARETLGAALERGVHSAAVSLLGHPNTLVVLRALGLLETLARHSRCVGALLDRDVVGRVIRAQRVHSSLTMTVASPGRGRGVADSQSGRGGLGGGLGGDRPSHNRNSAGDFERWWAQLQGRTPPPRTRRPMPGVGQPAAAPADGAGNNAEGGDSRRSTPPPAVPASSGSANNNSKLLSPTRNDYKAWVPGDSRPNASLLLAAVQVLCALASTAVGINGLTDHVHGYRHTKAVVEWLGGLLESAPSSVRCAAAEFFGSALHVPAYFDTFTARAQQQQADDDRGGGGDMGMLRTRMVSLLGMIKVKETMATVLMNSDEQACLFAGCAALVTWLKVSLYTAALPVVAADPSLRTFAARPARAPWPRSRKLLGDVIAALCRPLAAIERELHAALDARETALLGQQQQNQPARRAATAAPYASRAYQLPGHLVQDARRVMHRIQELKSADSRAATLLATNLLSPDSCPVTMAVLLEPTAFPTILRGIRKCRAELRRERLGGLLAVLRLLTVTPFARVPVLAASVEVNSGTATASTVSSVVAEVVECMTALTDVRVRVRALDVLTLLVLPTAAGSRHVDNAPSTAPTSAALVAIMTPTAMPRRAAAIPPAAPLEERRPSNAPPTTTTDAAAAEEEDEHRRDVTVQVQAGDVAAQVLAGSGQPFAAEVADVATSLLRSCDGIQLLVRLIVDPLSNNAAQQDGVAASRVVGAIRVAGRVLGVLRSMALFDVVRSLLRQINIQNVLQALLNFLTPHFRDARQRREITSSVRQLNAVCGDFDSVAFAEPHHPDMPHHGGAHHHNHHHGHQHPHHQHPGGSQSLISPDLRPAVGGSGGAAAAGRAPSESSTVRPSREVRTRAMSDYARQTWSLSCRPSRSPLPPDEHGDAAKPDRDHDAHKQQQEEQQQRADGAERGPHQLKYDKTSLLRLIADHLDASGLTQTSHTLRKEAELRAPPSSSSSSPTSGGGGTMTLDNVLTGYLRQQHTERGDTTAFVPPVDLARPHARPAAPTMTTAAGSFVSPRTLGASHHPRVGVDHTWARLLQRRESLRGGRAVRSAMVHEYHRHHRHIYDARPGGEWSSPTCVSFADGGNSLLMGTSYGDMASFDMSSDQFDEQSIESVFLYDRCFPEHIALSLDSSLIGFTLSDGQIAVCHRGEVPTHFILREGRAVRFSDDGSRVALTPDVHVDWSVTVGPVGGDWASDSVELQDALQRRRSALSQPNTDALWTASFDVSGNLVLGDAKIWDLRVSHDLPQVRLDKFNPNGMSTFLPSGNGVIVDEHVWDLRHTARVTAVCPDLHAAVPFICGYDGALIYAWRRFDELTQISVIDGSEFSSITKFSIRQAIAALAVDPGGKRIAAIADSHTGEGVVKIYRSGIESSATGTGVVVDDEEDDRRDQLSLGSSMSRRSASNDDEDDDGDDDDDGLGSSDFGDDDEDDDDEGMSTSSSLGDDDDDDDITVHSGEDDDGPFQPWHL